MNLSLKNRIIVTIILFILFYVIFAVYSDVEKIKDYYQKINLIYLGPILGMIIFLVFLRGLLQRFFLNSIEIRLSIKQNFFLFLAGQSMLITPGGSGQAIKSHFINVKYGYPTAKSLPLVLTERFCDFLSIVTIILFSLIFYYSMGSFMILVISSILLISIFIIIKNKKLLNKIRLTTKKIKFFRNMFVETTDFDDSLEKLFKIKTVTKAWLFDTCIFLIEGFVIYLGFLTFNIDIGYLHTFEIYYTSVLYGTLSFIPGGVGVLEGIFEKLLIQKNIDLALVTSLIIFIRMTTTWFVTALGYGVTYFYFMKKRTSDN